MFWSPEAQIEALDSAPIASVDRHRVRVERMRWLFQLQRCCKGKLHHGTRWHGHFELEYC